MFFSEVRAACRHAPPSPRERHPHPCKAGERIGLRLSLHPHMLRHTRAMHWYQSGMALEIISQLLGHVEEGCKNGILILN